MEILKIVGVGLATAIAYILVKQVKNEFAIFVALAGTVLILLLIVTKLTNVIEYFVEIVEKTGVDKSVFFAILKIVGVGYLTEFAANLCNDIGTSSMGNKIVLGGKIVILCLALPIITSLIDIVISIMP